MSAKGKEDSYAVVIVVLNVGMLTLQQTSDIEVQ
jgi:hypothetical protein